MLQTGKPGVSGPGFFVLGASGISSSGGPGPGPGMSRAIHPRPQSGAPR